MKQYGGLGRARGVGKESMAIQAILAGAVHNLKKVLRFIASRDSAGQSGAIACGWRLRVCLEAILTKVLRSTWPTRAMQLLAA